MTDSMLFPSDNGEAKQAPESAGEKRRHGRLRCHLLETNLGPVFDISASGVRIVTKKKPHVKSGDICILRFVNVPGDVEVRAKVIRSTKLRMRQYELALEFDALTPSLGTAIRSIAQASAKWQADRTGTA
ncbi:MAG: PilZ domain-containing protein [Planctomycetes bacterium]|nr:PilZ domain-containing protein [Planctomycetota bacterium]NOG55004.1 PilZ domain-containing protein [Planctomycetota bacterium]